MVEHNFNYYIRVLLEIENIDIFIQTMSCMNSNEKIEYLDSA